MQYGDFALEAFDQRDSPAALEKFMKDYTERRAKRSRRSNTRPSVTGSDR